VGGVNVLWTTSVSLEFVDVKLVVVEPASFPAPNCIFGISSTPLTGSLGYLERLVGRKHRNRPLGRLLLRFAMWPSSAGLSIIPRQLAVWPLME
jgi:hypothetical protein